MTRSGVGKRILIDIKDLDKFIEINKFTLDLMGQRSYHKRRTARERGDIEVAFTGGAIANFYGSQTTRTGGGFQNQLGRGAKITPSVS